MAVVGLGGEVVAWPGERVEGVVRRVVGRKRHLFHHFPDLDEDDLVQEGLAAVRAAWAGFDPARAAWSTFVYTVAARRMIDLWRHRARRAEREAKVAAPGGERVVYDDRAGEAAAGDALAALSAWADAADAGDRADGLLGGLGDDRTMEDWAGVVYRHAVRTFPPHANRTGHKWYTVPQVVAAVLVMRKYGLTTRGAEALFAESAGLRAALQLGRVPDHSWFGRAGRLATRKLHLFRRGRG